VWNLSQGVPHAHCSLASLSTCLLWAPLVRLWRSLPSNVYWLAWAFSANAFRLLPSSGMSSRTAIWFVPTSTEWSIVTLSKWVAWSYTHSFHSRIPAKHLHARPESSQVTFWSNFAKICLQKLSALKCSYLELPSFSDFSAKSDCLILPSGKKCFPSRQAGCTWGASDWLSWFERATRGVAWRSHHRSAHHLSFWHRNTIRWVRPYM